MTELAVPESAPVATRTGNAPARQQPTVSSTLAQWAEEARLISNIAISIAKTSFAGQLKGKPEEVTAVILAGAELGFKPMAALKAFDIIQGTPALRAHAMRGLVMSHGHKVKLVESDGQHCVYRGRRSDDEDWQEVLWTMPRAALLGLVNKPEWKKQPQTMLIARATGEICRLIASDVLHGVPYTAEELADSTPIEITRVQTAPLSIAQLTAPPREAIEPAPAWERADRTESAELAPHEWDIHTVAATLGMTDADLEARCHGVTGGPLADASEVQHQALLRELANEMAAQDNRIAQQ